MSIKLQAYHGSDSSWTQIGTDLVYGANNKITLSTTGKWCNDKIKILLSGVEDQDWDGSVFNPLCFTANTAGSTVAMSITGTPTLSQNFSTSTDGST